MKPKYINVESMTESIVKILLDVMKSLNEDEKSKVAEIIDIYDRAEYLVEELNESMREYLHQESQQIYGNFNNARFDYERENEGQVYNEMVERLDNEDESEQSAKDREWLTNWFWDTFGSFSLRYNFYDEIMDLLESFEEDN